MRIWDYIPFFASRADFEKTHKLILKSQPYSMGINGKIGNRGQSLVIFREPLIVHLDLNIPMYLPKAEDYLETKFYVRLVPTDGRATNDATAPLFTLTPILEAGRWAGEARVDTEEDVTPMILPTIWTGDIELHGWNGATDHNPLVAVLEPALEVSVDLSPFSHEACPEHYHNLIMSTTIIALPLSLNAGYTQDVMVPFIHLNSVMRDGRCIGQVKVSALGTDLAPGQYRLKLRLIDLEVLKENGLETATLATKVSDQLKIIVEEW
ncbi:hypothetical protein I302_103486 [Kwoniella bestiolae CBS 10118]|uniref:Uncharacterized protein n=1 Tax=Kwoniella bestiolae CBS 10118 TaxID=1296100 RepID=A0A1B9G8J8_9TREE|nr:hypothetical protein I302_02187 [Kwoniella bestiolae CBS 10118]OCF27346.1 hypothetical protein I302_02187 [Kwoniella bestiolae CBS 10118]